MSTNIRECIVSQAHGEGDRLLLDALIEKNDYFLEGRLENGTRVSSGNEWPQHAYPYNAIYEGNATAVSSGVFHVLKPNHGILVARIMLPAAELDLRGVVLADFQCTNSTSTIAAVCMAKELPLLTWMFDKTGSGGYTDGALSLTRLCLLDRERRLHEARVLPPQRLITTNADISQEDLALALRGGSAKDVKEWDPFKAFSGMPGYAQQQLAAMDYVIETLHACGDLTPGGDPEHCGAILPPSTVKCKDSPYERELSTVEFPAFIQLPHGEPFYAAVSAEGLILYPVEPFLRGNGGRAIYNLEVDNAQRMLERLLSLCKGNERSAYLTQNLRVRLKHPRHL